MAKIANSLLSGSEQEVFNLIPRQADIGKLDRAGRRNEDAEIHDCRLRPMLKSLGNSAAVLLVNKVKLALLCRTPRAH